MFLGQHDLRFDNEKQFFVLAALMDECLPVVPMQGENNHIRISLY